VTLQAVLSRLRAHSSSEEGFTIVEVLVAMMVITIVMTSLMYVMATSLKQVSFAKQREVASSLVDKTMEQARALPYSMIQTGLDDNDVTTSHDSNITISGSTYTYTPTGETIVHGSQNGNQTCPSASVCQAPLIPHQSTTTLNGSTYTISTYLTTFTGSAGAYRITVVVSWTRSQVSGVSTQVSSQSVIYSPANGCVSDQTHPFSSPCNPFLYAQASSGKGAITISPPTGLVGNAIQGVGLDQAVLQLAQVDSTMQIEQTSSVSGSLTTSGSTLGVNGTQQPPAGDTSSASRDDNDPGNSSTKQPSCPISQGSPTTQQAFDPTNSGNGITLTSGSTDTGCTVSMGAASSSSSPTCNNIGGIPQNSGLPCGSGTVQQTGTTASAGLTIGLAGAPLASVTLASVAAAPSASKTFASRLKPPSSCAGSVDPNFLATQLSDGCVHTDAQRSLGTVTLGALPSGVIAGLPGWGTGTNNFLVKLSNYSDVVSAESGIGAAAPCANQASTCTGTASGSLTYWTGNPQSPYNTIPVDPIHAPPGTPVPVPSTVSTTGILNGAVVNVSMTNTLSYGAETTSTSGTAPCNVQECKASAQVSSPIQGDIIYTVTVAGTTVANLDINVNLGTLAAQTNYKGAPNAG
jgi:type II secretory pathway pseudopilin PulG